MFNSNKAERANFTTKVYCSLRYESGVMNVNHACAGPLPKGVTYALHVEVIYMFK